MKRLVALAAAVLAGAGFAFGDEPSKTGTIVGTIRYLGGIPPATKILTTEGNTILHNDFVVDAKTKGLRFVVAALEGAAEQPKADKASPALIDQRDMMFLPRVIAVQHGQKVKFDNNDTCNHGVQAFGRKQENQFNVITPPNQPHEFAFAAEERPIMIGCQLHAYMKAWVYVFPHPWFGVTDAKGQFKIANVSVGKQTLVFHHADTGFKEKRTIEVQPGKRTEIIVEWQSLKK